jgi:alpha-glucosidase (family GH31 glycosyl hydrolase)
MVPFVTPDSLAFRTLNKMDCLIKNNKSKAKMVEWWDGFSAVIDFTNPKAIEWFKQKADCLINTYNIDGFKIDAGEISGYDFDDITYFPCTPAKQCELFSKFSLNFKYNELRACFKCGGQAIVQRVADRHHSWSKTMGLNSLIPIMLIQGLMGYPYSCPDMVGGGEYQEFSSKMGNLDEELFVRYCQCSALMPIMQLSFPFWYKLDKKYAEICIKYCGLRQEWSDYIKKVKDYSQKTGEPIIKSMNYQYNMSIKIDDQFMLGDDILVAPILNKGQIKRTVILPDGKWNYYGTVLVGGKTVEVDAPLEILPYFKKIN